MNGQITKGDRIKFIATRKEYNADEVGALKLKQEPRKRVETGDVGYLITGIKEAKEVQVGDTITLAASPTDSPIDGFEEVKPMVFAGIYPLTPKIMKNSEIHGEAAAQRCVFGLSTRSPLRLALGFVVAFWGCCTWKSFKNASSANLICR